MSENSLFRLTLDFRQSLDFRQRVASITWKTNIVKKIHDKWDYTQQFTRISKESIFLFLTPFDAYRNVYLVDDVTVTCISANLEPLSEEDDTINDSIQTY